MTKWISEIENPRVVDEKPVKVFERHGIRCRLFEQGPGCFRVQTELFLADRGEWVTISLMQDAQLLDVIILLQEAQESIGELGGPSSLPTIRMDGRAYFFDLFNGGLFAVDKPQDANGSEPIR